MGSPVNPPKTYPKPYKRIKNEECYDDRGQFKWNWILDGWDLGEPPKMVINVIGHADYSTDSQKFLKSAVINLFQMTKNTWVFTDAYDTDFSKIVGDAIQEIDETYNKVINDEVNVKTTCIGFATWDKIIGNNTKNWTN